MLWQQYVFRRGGETHALWDDLFGKRRARLLYITGRGFDPRCVEVLRSFVDNIVGNGTALERAELLLSAKHRTG